MTTVGPAAAEVPGISRARVEALSDGIFAIVLTLLVLEIKVPHVEDGGGSAAAVLHALLGLVPKFVSWVISFVTVCVIWLNHHRLFALTRTIDNGLFWWNANLLLWTSFIPFPTALMGDYASSRAAVSFYGVVMLLMALAFVLMRWHLLRHPALLRDSADLAELARGTRLSIVMGPVAYAAGAGVAWVSDVAAFACYAAIALCFVVPRRPDAARGR